LKQKNQKFKALTSYATNYKASAKSFELATLKQQMIFNASTYNLLNATKFNTLASLKPFRRKEKSMFTKSKI